MIKINDYHRSRVEDEEKKRTSRKAISTKGTPGELDADLLDGLKRAVDGSQARLALEYLYAILIAQQAQIEELQSFVEEEDEPLAEVVVPDPEPEPKKPAKKPEAKSTDASLEADV